MTIGIANKDESMLKTVEAALIVQFLSLKSRNDLYEFIDLYLKKVMGFDELSINLLSEDELTQYRYFQYKGKLQPVDGSLPEFDNKAILIKDKLFDLTIESKTPIIWNVHEVLKWDIVPQYVLDLAAGKIKTVAGISMSYKNSVSVTGNVFFAYTKLRNFDSFEICRFQELGVLLSKVIANINEHEFNALAIKKKEMQLSLTKSYISVRDKRGFNEVIEKFLVNNFRFNNLLVFLVGQQVSNPFIAYFDKGKSYENKVEQLIEVESELMKDNVVGKILVSGVPFVWSFADINSSNNVPRYIKLLSGYSIKKVAGIPLLKDGHVSGVTLLFSEDDGAFDTNELIRFNDIVDQVSTSVFNVAAFEKILKKNNDSDAFMSFNKTLFLIRDRIKFAEVLKEEFSTAVFFDEGAIFFLNTSDQRDAPIFVKQGKESALNSEWLSDGINGFGHQDPFFLMIQHLTESAEFDIVDLLKFKPLPDYIGYWFKNNVRKIAASPIYDGSLIVGVMFLLAKKNSFSFIPHIGHIDSIALQVSAVLSNILANEKIVDQLAEISRYKRELERENLYLQEELRNDNYGEIIGTSNIMKHVFKLASQVSKSNSTVLILGETGTGKELIARAIHNLSKRKDKLMVKVNCATLPENLIESELFGHERGSFTGATERRIGKFEMANNGTIFLDEVGELPIELQVKLLRVLQEKEIERIGGKKVIKVDVRIIAATNRDLLREVQLGNFRSDLFFRLNVFPITLPPLRDRKEDVPALVLHFLEKQINALKIDNIRLTSNAMKQLIAYNWPGNVRELEHLIERTLLTAKGKTIKNVYLPQVDGNQTAPPLVNANVKTLDQVEREHIISVLKMVNGKVSGTGGAAEILKIPSTTLSSKILRLKIKKGIV